jgi:hypothetical protein
MGFDEDNASSIAKDIYDIIMEALRALLLLNGFKSSSQFSHEAEVSFLKELGFNESDVSFLNDLRYSRNSVIYYGKLLDVEFSEKAFSFLNKIHPKLIEMVNKMLSKRKQL